MKPRLATGNGYNLDECVSALQKAVRRSDEKSAYYWASEMLPHYQAYLWRRLIVIANEDISIADPQVIVLLDALKRQYDLLTSGGRSTGDEFLCVANAVISLCRAKKSRTACDLTLLTAYKRAHDERREVEDYSLDRHTARGRAMGRDWDHWFSEGVRLDNEEPDLNPYKSQVEQYLLSGQPIPRELGGTPARAGKGKKSRELAEEEDLWGIHTRDSKD